MADRYRLLELHKANPEWSYDRLAAEAGCNVKTARLTCIAAGKSAADLMGAYAGPVLLQWLKALKVAATRGDHRPGRDWLLHAGSIDPLPETARGTGASIVIVNNPMPGMPGFQSLTIEGQKADPRDGQTVTFGNTSGTPGTDEPDR